MEPLPASLSTQIFPQQLGQMFADGQAQPGATVMASGGRVDLLKRSEQAALPVQRDADAGVAHREMQQPLVGVAEKLGVLLVAERDVALSAPGGSDFDDHFAPGG